jgi:pyridoxal phosphate-dependent aminotransferase EpsN
MDRIYLSPPHTSPDERALLLDAFDSNWVAPLGPHVDAFELELAARCQTSYCAALSSGTGALHLALLLLGIERDDEVWTSTLTFAATANAITYVGARPVFVDAERRSWNMDPALLAEALKDAAKRGRLPKALIVVDLYGQSADWQPILDVCQNYQVPIIEDAAEALGATYRGRPCGSFGEMSVLSFNGNKIITSAGGGALLSKKQDYITRARFLATQARDPAPYYQHSSVGYNYRLSNLLAAVGRGQLRHLDEKIAARRQNKAHYLSELGALPGMTFMPDADFGEPSNWLTCLTVDPKQFGASCEDLRLALEAHNIEARPVWKPMHLQPVFAQSRTVGGDVAQQLFERGLCLPSGSALNQQDRERIIEIIKNHSRV